MALLCLRQVIHPVVMGKNIYIEIVLVTLQKARCIRVSHIEPRLLQQPIVHILIRETVEKGDVHHEAVQLFLWQDSAQCLCAYFFPGHIKGNPKKFLSQGLPRCVSIRIQWKPDLFIVDLEGVVGDRPDLGLASLVLEGNVPLMELSLLLPFGKRVPPFENDAVLCLFRNRLPISIAKETIQRTVKAKWSGTQTVPANKK